MLAGVETSVQGELHGVQLGGEELAEVETSSHDDVLSVESLVVDRKEDVVTVFRMQEQA